MYLKVYYNLKYRVCLNALSLIIQISRTQRDKLLKRTCLRAAIFNHAVHNSKWEFCITAAKLSSHKVKELVSGIPLALVVYSSLFNIN
jgi:hypothetical protein